MVSRFPADAGKRAVVQSPKRLAHIFWPAARVTKALGVPRYCFQYCSSLGRIFLKLMGRLGVPIALAFWLRRMPGNTRGRRGRGRRQGPRWE